MTTLNNHDRTPEFVRLQTRYQQRVFSFILTLVPHWPDAEEILQETNMVLWQKMDQFEPGSDYVRWANQVAYFEVLKFRKRQKRETQRFTEAFLEEIAEETFSLSENLQSQCDALAACLKKLPDKDRTLISHRYLEDATVRSVAETLGRSLDAVYKALQRARSSLLACIRRNLLAEEQA